MARCVMEFFVVLFALLAGVTVARAQAGQIEHDTKARREKSAALTVQAATAFEDGDFRTAKMLLLRARRLFAEPMVDYNLARVYEELGETSFAIEAYRRYITVSPNAPNKSDVEARITALANRESSTTASTKQSYAAPLEADSLVEPKAHDGSVSILPLVPLAVGGLGIAVGVGLTLDAAAQADGLPDAAEDQVAAWQIVQDAREQETIGNVLITTGGIVLGAGLIWFFAEALNASSGEELARARGNTLELPF